MPDENNIPMTPFTGEVYIKSNDFRFYIGDCIWSPVDNKTGIWEISAQINNKTVANINFEIYLPASG